MHFHRQGTGAEDTSAGGLQPKDSFSLLAQFQIGSQGQTRDASALVIRCWTLLTFKVFQPFIILVHSPSVADGFRRWTTVGPAFWNCFGTLSFDMLFQKGVTLSLQFELPNRPASSPRLSA
jgi:hypothetical protein